MIQIDMSMPTNCFDCPFCIDYMECSIPINGRKWAEIDATGKSRPEWCPLKEQEPKTGHWIFESQYYEAWSHKCSECGKRMTTAVNTFANWCWNCGAKMTDRKRSRMKFTEELIAEDEKRWNDRNIVAELGYCGKNIHHRKNITNDDIRFYAYIMRKAYAMLKEQEPAKPVIDTYFYRCAKCGRALCGRTSAVLDNNRLRPNYCSECGQEVNWQL